MRNYHVAQLSASAGALNAAVADAPPSSELQPIGLSIKEAIRISGWKRTSLYGALKRGDIRSVKLGRRRLILLESLKRFLAEREA
jgi:hypothetical protein